MLKTALKPRWILALLGALVVATGFVFLSGWQFDRSKDAPPPPPSTTEKTVPLTEHFKPALDMMANEADQIVSAEGEFLPGKQILVDGRINDGATGYWVVAPFAVDGAPDANVIPVVRGWQPNDAVPAPAPSGQLKLTGRLLPTEAPVEQNPGDSSFAALSVAQLINVWDVPSYSGFIIANQLNDVNGESVDARSAGLDPVVVGPQPQDQPLNWLNIFYGIEWFVFAGFAVFLWSRLVADDYRRQVEDAADEAAIAAGLAPSGPFPETEQSTETTKENQ